MFSFRDLILFLAGFEFFHTLSHIFLNYFVALPLNVNIMVLTPSINNVAIIVNAVITILLLWWSTRLKR